MTRLSSAATRRRRFAGFTLAEVCVATLIVAIGTTAVFSVMLSVRMRHEESGVRDRMQMHAKQLLDRLSLYVRTDIGGSEVGAPGGNWVIPEDTAGTSWALDDIVEHNVTGMLPIDLRSDHEATLGYNVTNSVSGRQITVRMTWQERN